MSIAAPKMPWKACVFGRSRVTLRAECARKKAGQKRGGNARPALTRSNGYGAFKMASRFYRQGRIPAIDTHRERRAFGMEARP